MFMVCRHITKYTCMRFRPWKNMHNILYVKVIQNFYNLYTENATDGVNYTSFYTRVYTTV